MLLVVTKKYDATLTETGEMISLSAWQALVEADPELRLKTAPLTAVNPATGEVIAMPAAAGQSELLLDGHSLPFLSFRGGELLLRYSAELEDPGSPTRHKVASVAKSLNAIIMTDAGDEVLDW